MKCIGSYGEHRDCPAVRGTSILSPFLAAGVISPRQCLQAAVAAARSSATDAHGAATWISELTWRDFYTHVLVGFPRVSKNRPFRLKSDSVMWRSSDADLAAWKSGRTGYPIVDAGMRQLNQTGWMHNRLRMVTAMFLTKHLLIDWRVGEQYFMRNLIDGDLAANNGGWQWSASTGTDAAPYFRIFNPFTQSSRFDPDGKFIKTFCPELTRLPVQSLHDPQKLSEHLHRSKIDYPCCIVDHAVARDRALRAFKHLTS
jgi:deoxyribodipyrimidine photo-lyase